MEKSAGIVIKYKDSVLLGHPTNASWAGMHTFPKGKIENNECLIETALRETKEEVGIDLSNYDPLYGGEIVYRNKKGRVRKRVYWFSVEIENLSDIGLNNITIPKEQLQLDEIDQAKFYSKGEAEKIIFWRFRPILEELF